MKKHLFGYSHPGTYANYDTDAILNSVVSGQPVLIGGVVSCQKES